MPAPEISPDAIAVELHDRYWRRLMYFASRRLPDPMAAEDVAQETIRRVLEALRAGRVDNLEALPGFVFQTARNICMHHGRSARRERGALLKFSSSAPTVAREDPAGEVLSRERIDQLRDAIGRLDHDDQELLRMLYDDALDTQDIARRLGIDPGTLRVRKHRLLKRLGELVDSGNDERAAGTQE